MASSDRMRAEQLPAESVDQQHADALGFGQLQRVGFPGHPERGEDRGTERVEARFRIPRQRGLDGLRGHDLLVVVDDSAWANASTCSTASAPSAASLIRIVTSSDVIAPV